MIICFSILYRIFNVELLPSSNAVKSYREDTQKMPYREILISIKEIYT